jgi:hypothetical protein
MAVSKAESSSSTMAFDLLLALLRLAGRTEGLGSAMIGGDVNLQTDEFYLPKKDLLEADMRHICLEA